MEMREVCIGAGPEALRALANYLLKNAEDLEQGRFLHTHIHASPELEKAIGCDVIIAYPVDG